MSSRLGDDIVTDAVADPPRPRGTVIPDPPKPERRDTARATEPLSDDQPPNSHGQSAKAESSRKVFVVKDCRNMHFGNVNNFGMVSPTMYQQQPSPKNEVEVPPREFRSLLDSTKSVTIRHLDSVAHNVGNKWRVLGLVLNSTKADLDRLENDNQDDHHEKVYNMLLEWKQRTGGPEQAAMLGRLSSALWELRERDALCALKEIESDPRLKE